MNPPEDKPKKLSDIFKDEMPDDSETVPKKRPRREYRGDFFPDFGDCGMDEFDFF